jgi:hypothetical protein
VCKNQNYLKSKVKLKNHKDEGKRQDVRGKDRGEKKIVRGKDRGKIKLDAASVPHDKCREDYAATHATRQKEERGKTNKWHK